ncbi:MULTISPECIES: SDR family NAD(P)-dependent oxidoreductase [Citromicrobium]|uniref:SDR family NAD(P)-dependent oxidoreductase n=1 Tax=Citromicrobium TaxID=72173 RepID=UPI0001DD0A52|nr:MULTISPECIES: glucose 1-dehydrogenase [Citromicrobium]ALG62366.1 hypothetical protein WG74_11975 [Citromicrobium sp. JL477]KPM14417.1 hypothetical protein VO58_11495 [Citromicrobium sp. JL1351]KPM20897.1 hypothetical protein VM77_00380 [Citromicrobium sp. JL31]KPM26882.1 hypothetical protein VO57_06395 [Citromicrobium sp. JL2201]
MRFDGKTVMITGAGSGIGQEAAAAFIAEGATVAGIDLSEGGLTSTGNMLGDGERRFHPIVADVGDENSVRSAVKEAHSINGRLDIAFNNAGITQSSSLAADIPVDEFERVLRINVMGVWLCMREQIQLMLQQDSGGAIVNTASFLSVHSMAQQTAYVASKAAVLGMSKNAAIEYAEQNIRINCVAPGGTPTGMMKQSLSGLDADAEVAARQAIANMHPMKRLASTRDIANAVMFLSSPEAAFVTGIFLPVDGGWSAL